MYILQAEGGENGSGAGRSNGVPRYAMVQVAEQILANDCLFHMQLPALAHAAPSHTSHMPHTTHMPHTSCMPQSEGGDIKSKDLKESVGWGVGGGVKGVIAGVLEMVDGREVDRVREEWSLDALRYARPLPL